MLVDQYVKALVRDERAADAVWYAWNAGLLSNDQAGRAWAVIAAGGQGISLGIKRNERA